MARDLVVPLYRAGGQAQYIESPVRLPDNGDLFADTHGMAADAPRRDGDGRRPGRALGDEPAHLRPPVPGQHGDNAAGLAHRERLRFAQRLLETSDAPVDLVARESGFGSPDNLRKHFARTLRTTPQAYRRTFRAKTPA